MKFSQTLFLTFLLLISTLFNANAQNKMKLGKVSSEDLKMTVYEADSTAEAVILGEKSFLNIQFGPDGNPQLLIDIHRRIKILHEDAIDEWGNISFRLYNRSGSRQSLGNFKAYTINEIDGKVTSEKLSLKDAFKEEASEFVTTQKFTFKNVQVGSIIDYSYSIYSDFYSSIPDLYAQYSIPIVWREITFEYLNYFQYKYFITGSAPVYHRESKNTTENAGNQSHAKTRDYWVFKDVPALKQLSYMRPVSNYRTKINYELYGIQVPAQVYENYSTSWEEINKDLVESDRFGSLLDKLGPTKDLAESLNLTEASEDEKIIAAVNYVQKNFIWDGNQAVYPSLEWRKNLKEEKGNSSELNFTLIGMLRNLGIKAYPVILSTRANGVIFESFPTTEDFNYVITAIEKDGKYILVDPTSEFTGLNMLPQKCLNGKGLLISEKGPKWIPIETGTPYDIAEFVSFKIDEDLSVTANYQSKHSKYAAYFFRDNIDDMGGIEKYEKKLIDDFKDFNITDFSVENLEDLSKPLVENYSLAPEDYLQEMGDLILMKPVLYPNFKENPFKKDTRDFPIDFTYPRNYQQTVVIELPEGYAFDELPKNLRIATADRALYMSIIYSIEGNKLTMLMKFNIKETMFLASRYNEIKSFFDNVVAKENEQIVIREL